MKHSNYKIVRDDELSKICDILIESRLHYNNWNKVNKCWDSTNPYYIKQNHLYLYRNNFMLISIDRDYIDDYIKLFQEDELNVLCPILKKYLKIKRIKERLSNALEL